MRYGLTDGGHYKFGEFAFDAADNTLRRNGKNLALTPKALDLLRVFISNPGKLLSKAELMNDLWPDSFVEESNLAVTIRHLRKALGDDAQAPRFIETVPRQGYRFVAEVNPPGRIEPRAITSEPRRVGTLIPLAIATGLVIVSIALGSLYFRKGNSQSAPILSAPFAAEKLSTSGKVVSAIMSPDGGKVVYTVETGAGESVWLREIGSGNNVEIIPASGQDYYNLALSPDGNTLYFTRGPRTIDDPADVFSVSIFGGIPKKIVSNTRGWISLSPDGKTLSFVRCPKAEKENCTLATADATNGTGEKHISSRPRPFWISDNEIAPDGKSIVYAAGQSLNSGNDFALMTVDLETGEERPLTSERFFDIKSLEILPDNSGVLFTGSRGSTRQFGIWKLSYVDGAVQPITKDSNSYFSISLDDSGSRLIATQVTNDFRLARATLTDPNQKETITDQVALFTVAPNGGVLFQSESTGDMEIWRMNVDGSRQRLLTNVPGDDIAPVASMDDSKVYFCSNRSGDMQVWRMNADGSDQKRITTRNGGMPMFASDEWIYYQHGIDRTLWRVSADGAKEEPVLTTTPLRGAFIFSPSGTRAAFVALRHERPAVVVVSIPGGEEVSSLDVVEGKGRLDLAWLPDESAIAYTSAEAEGEPNTLWVQPIDGTAPRRAASFGKEEIRYLAFLPEPDSIAFIHGGWKHDVVLLSGFQ